MSEVTIGERHAALRTHGDIPDTAMGRFIFHPRFETFGGCVVLINFGIMTMDTHSAATDDDRVKQFVKVANQVLLFYYTVECSLRLYVMKKKFFYAGWNNLDFVIVVTGLISEILELFQGSGGRMDQIGMLKSLRMLRLLRLVRLLVAFRELYVLVAGIGRCMKTLFWASGLIFMVLNVWAILSVELLHERVQELAPSGAFSTCGWCENAFANIWYANLTWFQIISTADWAPIGRPLVEEYYWPYIFFTSVIFVVIWGLLNLIVAAIVDANIAAREDDVAIAAKIAAQSHNEAWQSFAELCQAMDEDGSGDITIEEFKKFWKDNVELQQHLTIMGVQEKDVDSLLLLMDEDGSGTLEQAEFIENFTTMRTLVEKSTLFFITKHVESIGTKLLYQNDLIQHLIEDIEQVKRATGCPVAPARTPPMRNSGSSSVVSSAFTQSASMNPFFNKTGSDKAYSSESDKVWRAAGTPTSALKKTPSEKSINAPHVEMADGDLKAMPPGWYYFGASLPPEASVWCKPMDPSSKLHSDHPQKMMVVTKEVPMTLDGQMWERLPVQANRPGVHFEPPMQVYATSSGGDMDCFPPEVTDPTLQENRARQQDVRDLPASTESEVILIDAELPWEVSWDGETPQGLITSSPRANPGARKRQI